MFWFLTVKDPFVVNKLATGKFLSRNFTFPVTSYHSSDSLFTHLSGLDSRQAKITLADEVLRNLLLLFHLSLGVGMVSPVEAKIHWTVAHPSLTTGHITPYYCKDASWWKILVCQNCFKYITYMETFFEQ
jgi:hypothetical protein